MVPQDIKSRPRQFMRQGIVGQRHTFLLPQFALVKFPTGSMMDARFLGGLRKGPSEVAVPIFLIAMAFHFLVAGPLTVYLAAIGGLVADGGKTIDRSCFQQDGASQNPGHPWKGLQLRIRFLQFQFLFNGSLDPSHLLG